MLVRRYAIHKEIPRSRYAWEKLKAPRVCFFGEHRLRIYEFRDASRVSFRSLPINREVRLERMMNLSLFCLQVKVWDMVSSIITGLKMPKRL